MSELSVLNRFGGQDNLHWEDNDENHRDEDDNVHPPPFPEMRGRLCAAAAFCWRGDGGYLGDFGFVGHIED